jgi:hypothetical protein
MERCRQHPGGGVKIEMNSTLNKILGTDPFMTHLYQHYKFVFPLLSICCFFFECISVRGVDFEVNGNSTLDVFMPNGTKHKTFTGTFSVEKNADKWFIREV